MKAHKHSKLIKAWADGAIIEAQAVDGRWTHIAHPSWDDTMKYRIKPPAPDNSFLVKVTQYKNKRLKFSYRSESKSPDFPHDFSIVIDKSGEVKVLPKDLKTDFITMVQGNDNH